MAKSTDLTRSQKVVALAPPLLVAAAAVAAAVVSLFHAALDAPARNEEAVRTLESPADLSPAPAPGTPAGSRHSRAGARG